MEEDEVEAKSVVKVSSRLEMITRPILVLEVADMT